MKGEIKRKPLVLHKPFTHPPTTTLPKQKQDEPEEMKEIKKTLLSYIAGDGSAGLRRSLELTHRLEVFDEAAFVLVTIAKIAVCADLEMLQGVVKALTSNDIKHVLKVNHPPTVLTCLMKRL